MSLPQWALDAGADPEIGWELDDVWGNDCIKYETMQAIYRVSPSGNLRIDRGSVNMVFLTMPDRAIIAAKGLIRALRGEA